MIAQFVHRWRVQCTLVANESLNASVRKAARNKRRVPSDQAATKLLWQALPRITGNWKRSATAWQAAKAQLTIKLGERFVFKDCSTELSLTQNFF